MEDIFKCNLFLSDDVLGSRAPGLKSGYNTQVYNCNGLLKILKTAR